MVACEVAQEVVAVDQHIRHVRALVVSGKLAQGEQGCDDAGRIGRQLAAVPVPVDLQAQPASQLGRDLEPAVAPFVVVPDPAVVVFT